MNFFTTKLFGPKQPPRRKELHQGSHKNVMEGTSFDTVVLFFKDHVRVDGTVLNIQGVGAIHQRISEILFTQLESVGISNHFIKSLNMKEQLVHAAEVLPFFVRMYTSVTADLSKRYGLEERAPLEKPLMEMYTSTGQLLSKEHLLSFGFIDDTELFEMESIARRTCDVAYGFSAGKNLTLQAIDLRFGRNHNGYDEMDVMLVDEISPRTLHFFDAANNEPLSLLAPDLTTENIALMYQRISECFGVVQPSLVEEK